MTNKKLAFQNDAELKEKLLKEEYKNHEELAERVLGGHTQLAYLQDRIFEGLPKEDAVNWPEQFYRSIEVGADLSLVTSKFLVWLLEDVKQYAKGCQEVLDACDTVIKLYERKIEGEVITDNEWDVALIQYGTYAPWDSWSVRGAARVVYYAALNATAPWSPWAARDAVWTSALTACNNIWDLDAHYKKMSEKLLELLKEAPVGEKE